MKKISNILKRIMVAFFIALLTMSLMPGLSVRAQEDAASTASSEITDITSIQPETSINTGRTGSLTVVHKIINDQNQEEVAKGVVIKSRIYFIAEVDERGKYTIDPEFASYPKFAENPDFFNNGFNYDEWRDCVSHPDEDGVNTGGWNSGDLEEFIKERSISPTMSKESNLDGETLYSGLKLGIYFVVSDSVEIGEYEHSFINFVYPVPILEKPTTGGNLIINYDPEASPKKAKIGVVHCGIRKQWEDGGYTQFRPQSVTFQIYSGDELIDTVTLDSSNNWQYNWLHKGFVDNFSVKEVPVDGYTSRVTVTQIPGTHDFTYTCVNGYNPPPDNPPPDNPPPDNPPPDNPPPDNPPPTNPPSNPPGFPGLPAVLGAVRALPQVLGARRLPQTGQLWWPLPILVIAGIFFIVKGIKKNAKMKAQNN